MILLNPKKHRRSYPDERSCNIMIKTIAFLENRGLKKIKKDYHEKAWNYDFVEFLGKEEGRGSGLAIKHFQKHNGRRHGKRNGSNLYP